MRYALATSAMIVALAGQAWAQGQTLTGADKTFLARDRQGASYELESAKLAATRAVRDDVKTYAQKLVQDHESYNAALDKLGKDAGLTLPTGPAAADKARLAKLEKLNGKAFDAAYVREAIRVNAGDKRDSEKEKAQTKSQAVKDFIARFADVDAEHERLAKQLEQAKG